jgi:uncharacterized protein (DUF1015 family)
MPTVAPFAALRPKPELAAHICELPYDVMSSEEAREIAAGNPLSFLHVSKPEIDLPPSVDLHAPEVYAKGKEHFQRLIEQGALRQDAQPSFYVYRQVMGRHSQAGLVAVVSCEDYLKGLVKKHELTRPDKEDDRVRHIEALQSQTGPVFLTYPSVPSIDGFMAKTMTEEPAVDFTARDGVRHTSWTLGDPAVMELIRREFARIPFLYIADGHHRSAAAARVYLKRHAPGAGTGIAATPHPPAWPKPLQRGEGPSCGHSLLSEGQGRGGDHSAFFLSVIFPHNQVQILPYNRVLKDLNGLRPEQLLEKLAGVFRITTPGCARPARRHEMGLYLRGGWHTLTFHPQFAAAADPVERLDVTLLQQHVLDPVFGIADPRTSDRISFVGGIRGTAELERLVESGDHACAFSLFPTGIEDLMAIADAGAIMPPKSTWFEPKLRDAMFCHLI